MRLTLDQILADNASMERFICERIPPETTRIDLGSGAWADLTPFWDDRFGWSLLLETDEPEWVDLQEVYQHFRRREMTFREWWREFEGERARSKVSSLEREVAVLRQELAQVPAAAGQEQGNGLVTIDQNGLPREVSTAEAAAILGVSKDTVLKLKSTGLLEYRNTGSPDSCRPVFAFSLRSVIALRTTYDRDVPVVRQRPDSPRRRVKGAKNYKHLNLDD
jgi:hypothetical protein